ncbi:MAG: DUF3641 domain-containing protein [Chlorobium sp.]|nr:DUF3641 domain-containing protein [Chlorobium sp.]
MKKAMLDCRMTIGRHCYGCTAGSGSSYQGALI